MKLKTVSEPLAGHFQVMAFYGPAGTGKSMRAQMVAAQRKVDIIIDDGLLICRGRIVAGKSAKTESNMVRAIRRAMFHFPEHREEVRRYLARCARARVMILSTSKGMSDDISRILGLPLPSEYISIQDVASGEEIEKALYERKQNKRHVIPVSQAQIRRNYTGRLVGRLRNLFSVREETEKTIVRPPFSYFGTIRIEPAVIEQISAYAAKSYSSQVAAVKEIKIKDEGDKLIISMGLTVKTGGTPFIELIKRVSLRVRVAVEQLTGMEVARVDINVSEVTFDD